MKIKDIKETEEIINYLEERQILKQYKKAKNFIISWYPELANFKLREPKTDEIYYFRINKQFRAFWFIKEKINEEIGENEKYLFIFKISNHQE